MNQFKVGNIVFERKTRNEIAGDKSRSANQYPVSLACINFFSDENLGFVVRAGACFGASEILVIGSIPPYRKLKQLSAGASLLVDIKSFPNPRSFMVYCRENNIHLVSLELTSDAVDITKYKFPLDKRICIITGNETTGVPNGILMNSDQVKIPVPGVGTCLNTSQAANIAMYEYIRQVISH